jgi:PHD/YefM family antitoxin component YafN of YafNO toxin-antitoxin module
MIDLEEVRSVTEFQRNTKAYLGHIKKSKKPLVLTVNGRAEAVVQSAAGYQAILDRLGHAETVASIRTGLAQLRAGQGIPLDKVERRLRKKHGFSS